MITIQEILDMKSNILQNKKVKIVRHKDTREWYKDITKDRERLLEYQKEQGKDIFRDCDYIVSFVGIERSKAIFIGVFDVLGSNIRENGKFYYELEKVPYFEDLEERVVIDWWSGTLAWHQDYHKKPKEIVQLLPKWYLGDFPWLLQFTLTFEELERLVTNPEANEDWKNNLSSINGVYLILDTKTGNQYIGSAYGKWGIRQRRKNYTKTKHGWNKELMNLCENDQEYQKNFVYSVLQTLPSNMSPKEIINIENLYKEKLWTRSFGLNNN